MEWHEVTDELGPKKIVIVRGPATALEAMVVWPRRPARRRIVPQASHLFEEPSTLAEVARLVVEWFDRHLSPPTGGMPRKQ